MGKQFTTREIKIFSELHSMGYSQKKLADLSGVSQATISRILQTTKNTKGTTGKEQK